MLRTMLIVLLVIASSTYVAARDTVLWRNIRNLSFQYRKVENDSLEAFSRQLLETARQQDDHEAQAMIHVMLGSLQIDRRNKQAAFEEFSQVVDIAETYDLMKQAEKPQFRFLYETTIPTYAQLAMLCDDLGKPELCLRYAKRGLEWVEHCDDKEAIAFATGILSEMLVQHGGQVMVVTPKDTDSEEAGTLPPLTDPPTDPPTDPLPDPLPDPPLSEPVDSHPTMSVVDTIVSEKMVTQTEYLPFHFLISRPWFFSFVFGMPVLAFLIYIIQWLKQRRIERQAELQAEASYREGQEQERSRLARELHDGVSNQLLAIEMKLRAEGGLSPQAIEMLSESREQVRRVSHELLPPEFEHATLDDVLADYAASMDGTGGHTVNYTSTPSDADWSGLPQLTALEVYRIVQEAVGNAMKHSHATTVSIGMHQGDDGLLTVIVSNDGIQDTDKESPAGIGLRTMQQRATVIGGTITFHQIPFGHVVKLVVNTKQP